MKDSAKAIGGALLLPGGVPLVVIAGSLYLGYIVAKKLKQRISKPETEEQTIERFERLRQYH